MDFDVFGPFVVEREKLKVARMITKSSINSLKDDLEGASKGLSKACGCYVFGIKAGKGIRPYYAGQALKNPILVEAFNSSNIQIQQGTAQSPRWYSSSIRLAVAY